MTIDAIVKKHWEREKVKFETKPFKWVKTLRTADCVFCKKHEKEKEIDLGFSNWAILTHVASIEGKAPEVCASCLPKIGIKMTVRSPRTALCLKCGCHQKEKIYGIGWPGWSPLPSIAIIGQKRDTPQLCPNCSLKLARKLGEKFIRGTWTSLTYAASSLLTSTKMTQNQANFAALAAGDSGAPDIANLQSGLDAEKSENPIVGDVYVATDTSKIYACYSADVWTQAGVAESAYFGYKEVYYTLFETIDFMDTANATIDKSQGLKVDRSGTNARALINRWVYYNKNSKFAARAAFSTAGGSIAYLGTGGGPYVSQGYGFKVDGNNLYAHNADGTTQKLTQITGITISSTQHYMAVLTTGVDIKFYVNGVLKVTHTENLPDSGAIAFRSMVNDYDGTEYVKWYAIEVEL